MDPVREIIQANASSRNASTTSFVDLNPKFCDPNFRQNEAKYSLFSYVPNHIQKEKNIKLLDSLVEANKIDASVRDLLCRLFHDNGNTFPGVGRIRGCFKTVAAATKRAEYILKNVDSSSSIMICTVGVPFPLVETGFAKDTSIVNLEQHVDQVMKADQAEKKAKYEKDVEDIKKREKQLKSEVLEGSRRPLDVYIEHRVKYAQVQTLVKEMNKKLIDYDGIICKCVETIKKMERENPDLKDIYLNAYMDACKEVGATPSEGMLSLMNTEF